MEYQEGKIIQLSLAAIFYYLFLQDQGHSPLSLDPLPALFLIMNRSPLDMDQRYQLCRARRQYITHSVECNEIPCFSWEFRHQNICGHRRLLKHPALMWLICHGSVSFSVSNLPEGFIFLVVLVAKDPCGHACPQRVCFRKGAQWLSLISYERNCQHEILFLSMFQYWCQWIISELIFV